MSETSTITSKSMVNIPAKIRRKYGLKQGSRIVFVDSNGEIKLIPVPPIMDLFGVDRDRKDTLIKGLKELEQEHRRESVE